MNCKHMEGNNQREVLYRYFSGASGKNYKKFS